MRKPLVLACLGLLLIAAPAMAVVNLGLRPDAETSALVLTFSPTGWAFGADVNIQLQSIPETSTLILFGAGLAALLGYGLRRKMA